MNTGAGENNTTTAVDMIGTQWLAAQLEVDKGEITHKGNTTANLAISTTSLMLHYTGTPPIAIHCGFSSHLLPR